MAGGADLSGDIIEEILSYLPVKSLLRFKSVSKSWYATISGASFTRDHLRRQRKNSHRFLIKLSVNANHLLIEFNKDWQVQESLLLSDHDSLEIIEKYRYMTVCFGDGLNVVCDLDYLYSDSTVGDGDFVYAIWNPSTRSLLKFKCPYNSIMKQKDSVPCKNFLLFGIGYDSLTNEYKFVICNGVQYAIFYCRNKCWSAVKNVEEFTFKMNLPTYFIMQYSCYYGFFSESNGNFYWYFINKQPIGSSCLHVVCFDAREDKIKRLPDPSCARAEGDYHKGIKRARFVASMRDNSALFDNCEMKILELKSGDGGKYLWTMLIDDMPKLPNGYIRMRPLYLAMKDEIIIFLADRKECNDKRSTNCLLVYNMREQTFFESHNDSDIPYRYFSTHHRILIPFRENLSFSNSENGGGI